LEYIANTQSDGTIIFSEPAKQIIIEKYDLDPGKILVLGNYPLSSFKPTLKLQKISETDDEIHCVYAGSIIFDESMFAPKYYYYYYLRFAESGIHIHFYSNSNEIKCKEFAETHPLLHYEGNIRGVELITQMSKYDLGFCLYNIQDNVMDSYLQICSPNKLFEYLAAGLPVITNIDAFVELLNQHRCVRYIDIQGDIEYQCREAIKIKICDDFLLERGLTMESNAERILDFYKGVINF